MANGPTPSAQELIPTPTGSEDLSSQEWKFPDLECLLFAFHHVVPKVRGPLLARAALSVAHPAVARCPVERTAVAWE